MTKPCLPLTLSSEEWEVDPAALLAMQVYLPVCLWVMELIIKSDDLDPIWEVIISGPEFKSSACRDHVMDRGSSPSTTVQRS